MNTTTDAATAQDQLARLADLLAATRRDPLQLGRLCDHARQASALQAALPPRYAPVLLDVVDRLESSALFSEESCSFSQKDLPGQPAAVDGTRRGVCCWVAESSSCTSMHGDGGLSPA